MNLYPAIDIRGGQCVRLLQGDYRQETVFFQDPAIPAQQFLEAGADRLHIVDLDGAKLGTPTNEAAVRRILDSTGLPCQLGGGLRSEADLERVFRWGVRWAILGTKAIEDLSWLGQMAERYPNQLVLGLDARDGFLATEGWVLTTRRSALELVEQEIRGMPLAKIVYTDIAKDGLMQGPSFVSLAAMQAITPVPLIASGGVSRLEDLRELKRLGLAGAIIGRALYERAFTLQEAFQVVG